MTLARRVALVDLDWAETDAILRAVRDERVEVRLVLGASDDEPGVRVADLLGVPHSTEVGDLTRELFDVAVIGDASPRRAALERLLDALGTPVRAPSAFPGEVGPDAEWGGGAEDVERVDAVVSHDDRNVDSDPGFPVDAWSVFETEDVLVERAPDEAAPSGAPGAPPAPSGALTVDGEAFAEYVGRALAQHRIGDASYVLHRFRIEGDVARAGALASSLAALFRGSDVVCRADDRTWILLCAGAPTDPARVERRLRRAWRRAHPDGLAVPPLRHESVALTTAEDTRPFTAAAHAWLGSR